MAQSVKNSLAMQETSCNSGDMGQSLGQEDPRGKEVASHFSIFAWEIPLIEEPCWLQSMGLQELGTT